MSSGNQLAAADKGAKSKDSGAETGSASAQCKKATLVVTVVRKDGAKGKTFSNDVLVEGVFSHSVDKGAAQVDKPKDFGSLEPTMYQVSARPHKDSGYAFDKLVTVTVGGGEKKEVQVKVIPHELVSVRPNTGKSIRQYVNLQKKEGALDWGNEVEVTAHLKDKVAGVSVYWDLEPGKENGKYEAKVINGKDHRSKITTKSRTDAEGVARATLTLGRFGGNTFRAMAALSEHVDHPSAAAKKSDEFVVWRKHWYQISYPAGAALPSRSKLKASFDKVFLASEESTKVRFKKADHKDAYRPSWQFDPKSGNDDKLCVGTHNIKEFAKLYRAPGGGREPKSHIILCNWQFDAEKSNGSGYATKWSTARFQNSSNPEEIQLTTRMSGFSKGLVGIFDPPLKSGTKLVVAGTWKQYAWDATASTWKLAHEGLLESKDCRVDSGRGFNRQVIVKRPSGNCKPGCVCGGASKAAKVDGTNYIDVKVRFSAAHGTYLGWADDPFHSVVILGMNAAELNDVINHEIGHLFSQTPTKGIPGEGIPDHPHMYQRRGGSGTHCSIGANWIADAAESPQLDPTKEHELDAHGRGSGRYSGGTCIMFGIGNAGKREFCVHCALQLKARDLSTFKS